MPESIIAPVDLLEDIADLRLPPSADARLQELMNANNEGRLSEAEREQLAELVDWSESLSLLRAKAIHTLERRPA